MKDFRQMIKNQIVTSLGTKLVTLAQLIDILANTIVREGMGNFANIIQLTEPKCTQKDRQNGMPFNDQILKLSEVNIILNTKYDAVVRNQNVREGNDESAHKKGTNTMPLEKGEHNNFFGYFRGQAVIEYKPNANMSLVPNVQHFLNGKAVDKKTLPDVLPKTYSATNQGTDKEILWRKLYVKNIIQITMFGQTYKLI